MNPLESWKNISFKKKLGYCSQPDCAILGTTMEGNEEVFQATKIVRDDKRKVGDV